jgi:DNA (cytosine-5)-methyltransferase 1
MIFYNEIEPYCAAWLTNLMNAGQLGPGVVDARDIREVAGSDVSRFSQAHFFAGIGGWPYALRLAGWPANRPVWTGSCPCQPFSAAGRKGGFFDDRHLWPEWFRLIKECRPPVILGEQVASPDGLHWLDTVFTDLEREGYAVGAADLPAAGIGAPHKRQRLFFVAIAGGERCEGLGVQLQPGQPRPPGAEAPRSRPLGILGNSGRQGPPVGQVEDVGHRAVRLEGPAVSEAGADGVCKGFWSPFDLVWCQDGKYRPVESKSEPLAVRVPNRVGKLRAYGNSIVPPLAATFIRAVMS